MTTRPILIIAFAIIFALPTFAQEATLGTPETAPTAVKLRVTGYSLSTEQGCVSVSVAFLTSGNVEVRRHGYRICSDESASIFADWHTAIGSARPGETGVPNRRMNFRILGFLLDEGLLPTGSTLVP